MTTLYLRASATRVGGAAALPGSGDLPDATICMDVYNGQVTQGNYPQSWSCNTCWNQKWLLAGGVEQLEVELDKTKEELVSIVIMIVMLIMIKL